MKLKEKCIILLCLIWIIYIPLQAQEIITTSGNYGTTSAAHVTWTIGEPLTETAAGLNNVLTQGFNQGDLIITTIKKPEFQEINIRAFPNPASDHLKIVTEGSEFESLRYVVYDMNGKTVLENQLSGSETDIPIGNLSPSTYLIKVFQNRKEIILFKIIKK